MIKYLGYGLELSIDLRQWMIGANMYTDFNELMKDSKLKAWNVFFLCFRLGYSYYNKPFEER